NMVHAFELKDGNLKRTSADEVDTKSLSKEELEKLRKDVSFRSGLLHDAETDTLYSLDINNGALSEIPLSGAKMVRKSPCGQRPYDIVRGPGGKLLYVSDWAARAVLAVDPKELRVVAKIAVGEHPNQMAVHPEDDRLFVACASSNCMSVIDT